MRRDVSNVGQDNSIFAKPNYYSFCIAIDDEYHTEIH